MSKILKLVSRNVKLLEQSEQRLEDLYRIIFNNEKDIMTELSTMTKKVTCSYATTKKRIEAIARGIALTLGSTNRYIGLYADNSPEWIILFWGILQSGNKPYLINLRQPQSATAGIMSRLDTVCTVSFTTKTTDFGLPDYDYQTLYELGKNGAPISDEVFANEFALSTSGTTLKEKICIYTGKEISAQILNATSILKTSKEIASTYEGGIKMLAFLPLYHVFGLTAMYFWFTFVGATFVFLSDRSPEAILRTVRHHKVTHLFAVPLLWHGIEKAVKQNLSTRDDKTKRKFEKALQLSLKLQNICPKIGKQVASKLLNDVRSRLLGNSVKFCISGGSNIRESTLELMNGLGYTLVNGYGMSEIGISSVEFSHKPKDKLLGSIGKPFASVKYKIGEQGQLLVCGDSVCKRIIIDGQETICDSWFDTGDIVHMDDSGRYYIDGRISDIVFGDDGENLNPDFAEKAFVLPKATAFCVLGNHDRTRLMLVVQIPDNLLNTEKEALVTQIEACNQSLPHAYRVRDIYFTFDSIMAENAIKVSRQYLNRELERGNISLFDSIYSTVERHTYSENSEIKKMLREIFAEILKKPLNEITDNGHFMNDLGGTSLDYFALISTLDERFGIELGFEEESFRYTLNDLADRIKDMI